MKRFLERWVLSIAALMFFGCATTQKEVYIIREAEQVTDQALEPVMLESGELKKDLSKKFAVYLPTVGTVDELMTIIQTSIAETRRFTKVLLNSSEGDIYIVQPRIDSINQFERGIPTDPTRKRFIVKAKVRLDVLFYNSKNQKELVKSFYDERVYEERISSQTKLTRDDKRDYCRRAMDVAFRAAADHLGNGFNPSYERGTVSRISGKVAYVQINTGRIRTMPKKQQKVEVIDDDNKVLATIDELTIEDGTLSGKIYEKSGRSIRSGQKVRARIITLAD